MNEPERVQYGDYPVELTEITDPVSLDSVWQAGPLPERWHGPLVLGFGGSQREAVAGYFRAWVAKYEQMPPSVKDRVTR